LAQRPSAQIQAIDKACFLEQQLGADATVREDHFHFDGVDYFRGHAAAVQLGDVGEKKRAAAGHHHLDVQARLPRDKLHIERVTRVDLQGAVVRSSDIIGSITVAEVGSLGASTVARQLEDKTLSLTKLEASPRGVIDAANECAAALNALGRAGKAGRLVHQVFVILETATAHDLSRATRWSVSGADDDCVLTGIGADGRRCVVVLGLGTTFAYLLLKPKWNAHLRKTCKRIDDWEDDPWPPELSLPEAASP
jgi:hypothetical protein